MGAGLIVEIFQRAKETSHYNHSFRVDSKIVKLRDTPLADQEEFNNALEVVICHLGLYEDGPKQLQMGELCVCDESQEWKKHSDCHNIGLRESRLITFAKSIHDFYLEMPAEDQTQADKAGRALSLWLGSMAKARGQRVHFHSHFHMTPALEQWLESLDPTVIELLRNLSTQWLENLDPAVTEQLRNLSIR